jgi:hypothetical protein
MQLKTSAFLKYTVPKDYENFLFNNYGAWALVFSNKVFVIESWRPATIVISNEIYYAFGTVNSVPNTLPIYS